MPEPEPIKVKNQMEWEVEDVLNSWHQRDCKVQYLLHWKGFLDLHNTWRKAEWINTDELISSFHSHYLDKPQPGVVQPAKCKCG